MNFAQMIAAIITQIFSGIWFTTGALIAIALVRGVFHFSICN